MLGWTGPVTQALQDYRGSGSRVGNLVPVVTDLNSWEENPLNCHLIKVKLVSLNDPESWSYRDHGPLGSPKADWPCLFGHMTMSSLDVPGLDVGFLMEGLMWTPGDWTPGAQAVSVMHWSFPCRGEGSFPEPSGGGQALTVGGSSENLTFLRSVCSRCFGLCVLIVCWKCLVEKHPPSRKVPLHGLSGLCSTHPGSKVDTWSWSCGYLCLLWTFSPISCSPGSFGVVPSITDWDHQKNSVMAGPQEIQPEFFKTPAVQVDTPS